MADTGQNAPGEALGSVALLPLTTSMWHRCRYHDTNADLMSLRKHAGACVLW